MKLRDRQIAAHRSAWCIFALSIGVRIECRSASKAIEFGRFGWIKVLRRITAGRACLRHRRSGIRRGLRVPVAALLRLLVGAAIRQCRNGERRMHDVGLSELLSSRGFEGASAQAALDRLCRHGLTRQEPDRRSEDRGGRRDPRGGLSSALPETACRPAAPESPRTGPRVCRALRKLRRQRQPPGGGANAGRNAVCRLDEAAGGGRIAGHARRSRTALPGPPRTPFHHRGDHTQQEDAGRLLDWSDVTAIWTSSEISHKRRPCCAAGESSWFRGARAALAAAGAGPVPAAG